MKTVLLIDAVSARYFRREHGLWRLSEKPLRTDKLWVIANIPEETLEPFQLPLLFGRDRSMFLERRLAAAFPHSLYRAAPVISGNWLKAGTAVITGLTTAEPITGPLDKLDIPITGVWGMAMLLTLMAKRISTPNMLLVMPSAHYLRILVLKEGIPVLTRCIQRYGEVNESDSDASEILRTRQHLENRRFFEHDAIPPVLYLGDATGAHLTEAGIALLPLPDALRPKGDAAHLHPLFEFVVSSPGGQLAPLQLRASHLAENLRLAAYTGCAASVLTAVLFGQNNFRAMLELHGREKILNADLQKASTEREHLAIRINATGTDPALVRQATRFAQLEMDAAPTPDSILQFTARAIADLPQVRIKSLAFRFPKPGEHYCQGRSVIDVPLLDRKIDLPLPGGSEPDDVHGATEIPNRYAELQFTILLTDNLAPAAQSEVRKHISAVLKTQSGVQLMQDPAAFSMINTLKGGFGMDTGNTESLWCMSIPWKILQSEKKP